MGRLIDKMKNLKIGSTVVIYGEYDMRNKPYETTVTKIGNKYIHTGRSKFELNGYGEYGWYLFPGSMEEFNYYREIKNKAKLLLERLKNEIYDLDMEELNIIESFIKK